jgi:hypothetical protein
MKKVFTAALALLIPLLIAPSAGAAFISDTYWGGTTVQSGVLTPLNQDVIGTGFDIVGMDVTRSGGNITVVLSGAFFAAAPINPLGDLYISTTGLNFENPSAPNHPNDRFTSGEGWNWYVSTEFGVLRPIGNFGAIVGTLGVALGGTVPVAGSDGRINQALTGGVNPSDPTSYAATVSPNIPAGTLTYIFPDLDAWAGAKLGLHWTMLCGNDVVEVEVPTIPTPEPGTMLLAGCGLIALAVFRRKFKK